MSVQPRRVRLKPWLLAQVNSGRYPGLQWLSSDQRLFQIPWRHATRHTPVPDEENTIFKAWAVETGKYQVGVDEPDPAKWKANLRCALNKSREFQLKYDGTKETPVNPFKIYEVCEQSGNADGAEEEEEVRRRPGQSQEEEVRRRPGQSQEEEVRRRPGQSQEEEVRRRPGQSQEEEVRRRPGQSQEEEMPNLMGLSIKPRIGEPSSFVPFGLPPRGIQMPLLPVTSDLQAQMVDSGNFGLPGGVQDLNAKPESMETSITVASQNQVDHQNPQAYKYDLLSSVPLTDLDLKFLYRGRTAGSLTVSNPQGCRLYYGHLEPTPEQVDLFGPVTLQQVLFPGTSEIQNQKQRFYTEALLDVMDRGLILEIEEQDIYAIRLCQCKVFWSGPGMPEQGPPNPMERERRIRVFSLNDFLQGLIVFQKGEAPNPPPFEVYFCFGEDWPDKKPKEKKLIIVQVVPVVARILTEMFSGELNWSTDSIRLQISHPDVKDQTVEQFKELQRLLQSQLGAQGPWAPTGPPGVLGAPSGFSLGTS